MLPPDLITCLRRNIRKTCPARTVVLPMQPTAGFDELS
jgi:hypothetical protein